ncbi:hypothetical protein [Streptomyces sp. NBC_00847]|uniref:hypothetical protein n=1 Tax=Streptomyces sp. NBC_00847 TaxID=2975850 RepID=UPI00225DEBA6|nr:hypothetical protein [Streptomyces sp. NBC_00847]MCX4885929.1 hypothetical protein [Streptomyces sp. NBC_00847]
MTDFRPTRTCPHRLCKPLHGITALAGLVFLSAMAADQPWLIALFVIGGLLSFAVYQLVHRQTMVDTARQELAGAVTVTVRTGWARAAAALDGAYVLAMLAMCASALRAQSTDAWSPPNTQAGLLAPLGIAVALMVLTEVLHKNAVRVHVTTAAKETTTS